jgi:SPOR domain
MADDPTFRFPRTNDPFRRAAEPRSNEAPDASDPLAELARLIGKSDPYAQFGVTHQRQTEQPQAYPASSYVDENWRQAASGARSDGPRDQYQTPRAPAPSYGETDDWRSESEDRYSASRFEPDMHVDAADDGREPAEERKSDHYFDDAAPGEPHDEHIDEQIYDDPPRARRRGGLATALALVGCAMLGTAGAYGYRSYYGQAPTGAPPPVIAAESSPSKIIPSSGLDSQSGKVIQERLANAGKEQLVTTQEEPVALKDLGTQASPRVILPAPVAPLPPGSSPTASSGPGSSEPKKVRTLTIHPDGADVSGRPVDTQRTPSSAAAKPPAPARSSGGPLSLAPQASEPAPAQRTRTATLPPSPAGGGGGNYVQLSSQKSEAEAQASFRNLQAKYPNELGGRQGVIRRADLGSKGVFYRTMVGPFASAVEANQFCANFKALGAHCVVPNN